MALLDDLRGILSAAEFAKLEADAAVKTRLERGDELRSYYDGDEPPSPSVDLSGIERMLDSKLAKLDERIDTRFNTLVEQRGTELVNNAVSIATHRADELNRVYGRHFADFGEQFDSVAFNEFLNKPENSVMQGEKRVGSKFQTITDAYEAMTAERRVQKKIDTAKAEGKAEGIAASSGRGLPGTTPGPAVSSNIRVIMARGRTDANGQPTSRVDKAAAALDRRMANAQEQTA